MMRKVYLDHAATTAMDGRVLQTMLPYLTEIQGNASSAHFYGREAQRALDSARDSVAGCFGVRPSEIYFTASGSESGNWAVKGGARAVRERTGRRHVLVSAIEHPAVLNSAKALAREGFEIGVLPVDSKGIICIDAAESMVRTDTALVCVMAANNEVGTVQPVQEIAEMVHARGAYLFSDAVQAAGAIPIGSDMLGTDMLSISAHKFYGPKGMGALYVKRDMPIQPFLDGGEQERGLRGGTSNVAGAVGLAAALSIAIADLKGNSRYVRALRDRFLQETLERIGGADLNGDRMLRLPGNANISFSGVDGTVLLHRLDRNGIAASAGSACSSGAIGPSHVLTAMGQNEMRAKSAIRFTFGKDNTEEDVEYACRILAEQVCAVREDRN